MEFRDLEYFSALAVHQHVGRAAEALGLSQPALSLSLRRLERSMGTKLVHRTPKGVEVTDVGLALLNRIGRLQLVREDVSREIEDIAQGRTGRLRIGAGPGPSESLLPPALARLSTEADQLSLTVTVANNNALTPALCEGDIDLVVNHIPAQKHPDLAYESLPWQDEFVVYASVKHRLAKRKRIDLSDLVNERWAVTSAATFISRETLQRSFEEGGLPSPQIALASDSVMVKQRTVAASNLLGFSSRRMVTATARAVGLVILDVAGLRVVKPVGIAYRKDGYMSPAALRAVKILKSTAAELART